jgi:hypothetical protein
LSRIIDNAVLHPIQQITSKKWGRDLKEANKEFGSEMHHRLDPLIYTAPRQTLNRVKVVSFAGIYNYFHYYMCTHECPYTYLHMYNP